MIVGWTDSAFVRDTIIDSDPPLTLVPSLCLPFQHLASIRCFTSFKISLILILSQCCIRYLQAFNVAVSSISYPWLSFLSDSKHCTISYIFDVSTNLSKQNVGGKGVSSLHAMGTGTSTRTVTILITGSGVAHPTSIIAKRANSILLITRIIYFL